MPRKIVGVGMPKQRNNLRRRLKRWISIKRAVYLGGSMSLEDGMHVERTEFMLALSGDNSQALMLEYMERTERGGDLPLYDPAIFEHSLKIGHFTLTSSRTIK